MLENTFIHLPGHGPNRERKLWEHGIKTWDDYLENFAQSRYHNEYCKRVASSKYALKCNDSGFFADCLPPKETWRAFPHFDKIAYLDIETTGLGKGTDYITVIGLFDGRETKSYVCGQNLEEFQNDIGDYEMVVTFNGAIFDLPFIRREMQNIKLPKLHSDLRFVLSSLGVNGGLKKIEQQFGMEREDDLKGLNGYDAVLLWKRYKKENDENALDKLVRYNAADIANLKKLMEWAYKEKKKQRGID